MGRCQKNGTRRHHENYLNMSAERIHQVSGQSGIICSEKESWHVLGPTAAVAWDTTASTQNNHEILGIEMCSKPTVPTIKGERSMKTKYSITVVAAVALLAFSLPVHASEMDSRIESSARQSYVFKTYLQGDTINIQSRDGVVTLTGTVSEESHKTLAEDTVAGLPGVVSVDNRLEIRDASPVRNSDEWLATKVKTALLFHENVSALTEVSVKNGVVTLRGDADNLAQKDLTTEYARDVEGVKYVINDMTVAANPGELQSVGEQIDDASITAQVKMTLLFHRSTSAINTKVETNHGVVTLTGMASSPAERDLATKLVSGIKGVRNVKNLMTIGVSE